MNTTWPSALICGFQFLAGGVVVWVVGKTWLRVVACLVVPVVGAFLAAQAMRGLGSDYAFGAAMMGILFGGPLCWIGAGLGLLLKRLLRP